MSKRIALINTSILTSYGEFQYEPISIAKAQRLIRDAETVESAVGHQATAAILTELLELPVVTNRIEYRQEPRDTALVVKLRSRVVEGKILSTEEIEEIGYDLALLKRSK